MKKHVKGIMIGKGYVFLGSVLGSSLTHMPRSKAIPTAKYLVFKKSGVPKYVFIHASKVLGLRILMTSTSRVYKRPLRGGGYLSKFGMICCRAKTPHALHSLVK